MSSQSGHDERVPGLFDEELSVEEWRIVLESDFDRLTAEGEALQQELGVLRSRRTELAQSNPVAEIHEELSLVEAEVVRQARRWAVLTVAEHVIDSTREEFQRERQGPLLQRAQTHFREFSLGRYTRITEVLGQDQIEKRIQVEQDPGPVKGVEALSRGTAEQLFLALRLAMIREFARNSEPMPVLMDDVMVNFDPKRALAVSRALIELSETHQVLVLTCHPGTVSQLEEAAEAKGALAPTVIQL